MTQDFAPAMRRAAQLVRVNDLAKATRVIQDTLSGQALSRRNTGAGTQISERQALLAFAQPNAETHAASEETGSSIEPPGNPGPFPGPGSFQRAFRIRKPLGDVLRLLREGALKTGTLGAMPGMSAPGRLKSQPPPVPEGAQFISRSFTCVAGTRGYKLYIPASAPDRPRGLIVMLHGCKQGPDDFAAGTNMNAVAEAHGLMVAYPGQANSANSSSCWNWFNPADQLRGSGEPSIIAGITQAIVAEFHIDRQRVFVAGLSAGGAMAVVMGEAYPDLYAAVGVHSGLGFKSANDVVSAFAAMRGEPAYGTSARSGATTGSKRPVRTIVFHGTADQIVRPSNASNIFDAARRDRPGAVVSQQGFAKGRSYRRLVTAGDGPPDVECWLIEGAGHVWSGGRHEGSYTDPQGPDASAEMTRFFLA